MALQWIARMSYLFQGDFAKLKWYVVKTICVSHLLTRGWSGLARNDSCGRANNISEMSLPCQLDLNSRMRFFTSTEWIWLLLICTGNCLSSLRSPRVAANSNKEKSASSWKGLTGVAFGWRTSSSRRAKLESAELPRWTTSRPADHRESWSKSWNFYEPLKATIQGK